MADSKNYIVRYDIQANTTEATTALEGLVKMANEVAAPMKRVQAAVQNTQKALFHLRQNSKFEFNPTINTTTFQNQLRTMLQEVRTVATQMHAAIYEALTASPAGTKAAQTGIKNAFKLASTTPELKKQLDETEKFLQERNEQLKRFSRTFSQSLTQEQRTNAEKQRAIAKADRDMLKERASNIRAAIAAQEELDKKLVVQQEKTKKAVKTKVLADPKSTPLTNITPAVIREWGKVFGDAKSKSLTVNIRGNASGAKGALTVIDQVIASLNTLQSQASFNITPTLNAEAFAAAETQLKHLASLSAAVVTPFAPKDNKTKTGKQSSLVSALTKEEKTKLNNAQKQIKAWNEKIAPVQSRLDANRAIPEDQRTPAIKGQITRDTKTLASYTASKAEQEKIVNTLQSKSAAAIQAGAKPSQPLAVDIVGNLTKINTPAKLPVIPIIGEISKLQGKVTEAIPVNVKIMGDQVASSLKAVTPTPMLDVMVRIVPDGVQQQIQAIADQSKPITKTTSAQGSKPVAAQAPLPKSHPVYTPPSFTTDDEKQLNSLAARYGNLIKEKEKAEKAVASAKAKLDKSGGSNRAYDNYLSAQRKLGELKRQSTEVFNKLNPLMHRQFQSTSQRALTEEEIVKGIGAQNIVKQLESKKHLTKVQKTQLAEAQKTLSTLRAPAQPPMESTPPAVLPKTPTENLVSTVSKSRKKVGKGTDQPKTQTITLLLDTTKAVTALEDFIAKIKASSPQNIFLSASATSTPASNQSTTTSPGIKPPIAPLSTGGSTQKSNTQKGTTGYQASSAQERYDKLKKQSSQRATKQLADNRFRAQKQAEYASQHKAWYNQQQALYNKLFEPIIEKPTKPSSAISISNHKNKLGRMRSAVRNSILPFVSSQGDLESIFKNYKSFAKVNQAWGTVGADGKKIPFVPTPNMPNGQMLRYLTDVRTQMQADGSAVPVKLNNYIGNLEEQIRQSNTAPAVPQNMHAPSGFMGSGKNRVSFGTTKPSEILAPKGYHWEKTKNLASRLSNPQMEGFQRALAEKEAAWQNLRNVQASTQSAIDAARNPRTPYINRMTSISNTLSTRANTALFTMGNALNAVDRYSDRIGALRSDLRVVEGERQALLTQKSLNSAQTSQLINLSNRANAINQEIATNEAMLNQQRAIANQADRSHQILTQRRNAIDAARTMEENVVRASMLARPMAERRDARTAYTQARKNVNAYTNGYQLAPDETAKPSKTPKPVRTPHQVRTKTGEVVSVEQLRAQAQNAMLPFAQNKEQLNMLTKHRRFFRQAVTATGIMPTPGMEAPRMLQYLQGVSNQMQQASVAVPWTLQNQINKLEDQVAASKGIGQPAPSRVTSSRNSNMAYGGRPMSMYDRSRKWAYPFTGPSSFGVRTPMAVDMAKGMGVMFAIGGAMSAIGGSFGQAMEYQNTMRTTQAILQNGTESYSQGSFQNMEATVRNVGVKTKFSAPEVANAAKFLAMAGYDIDAINSAIRPIADLALIGDSDLGETADKMTNIMTTFNIAPEQMRQAANIMATTATRSNTDLMMLAESAKYGGGVAHMYGHNDPNLFADTMAIFGVMGNAGIQASSAGTSLRMMYQNIFNPNKKQAALLNLLESQYGISTRAANGEKRSMADIIIDMANKIPANVMPDIVGKLFRITAQPGANAALLSATDIAMQESGGDMNTAANLVDETNAFVAKLSGKNSKSQLSALAALIQANRNSMQGNISGAIADEKQNTIQGLWAQVTSTFTEGIVQSFEKRQGGFEEILKKLRDYFAKPETVQMLQNLMDMIIEIGKVMGWFVKIWANLYNAAPGMIKFWVVTQMAVTQMGTLIAPFISLLGVINRLQRALGGFAGFSAVGGASNAMGRIAGASGTMAGGAATSAAMNAPFIVGHTPKGKPQVISGNIAKRAHQAVATNARKVAMQDIALASSVLLPYPGGNTRAHMNARALNIPAMVERQNRIDALNNQTREHYAAVRERARRIYGPARAGRAFKSAFYALPTLASFSPMLGGIKSMMMGLLTSLAKAVGFLVNPVTLAVGALAGLGYGLYKLKQRIDGNTDAQKASRAQANRAADQTSREMVKEGQWYRDLMSQDLPEANPVISSVNTNAINQSIAQKERFDQLYATIFNDFSKDASKQSVKDVATKWQNDINSNPAYSLAIGNANNYDFSKKHKQLEYNPYNAAANVYIGWHNARYANEDDAINQRRGMVQDALMIEGANDARTQQALKDITNLRQKYLAGETQYKSQSEYLNAAQQIRDKYMAQFSATIPAANMTPEQFKENRDRSVFDTYQMGARNLLDATIEGRLGTTVGKLNAYEWLWDTKNKAKRYTDEWYNSIANIIGDYHVIYNAISADGKQQANVELILSSLPNGQLNFTSIIDQIRAKVNNFNMTVQGFSDIIGTAYKMMAEAGVIDIKDRTDFRNQILHQMTGAKFNDETPKNYYRQWIGNNKNSEWVKAGISEEKYIDFIMGRSGKSLNLGNRVVTLDQERKQMWRNIAGKTADTILEQNKGLTEQAKKLSGNSPSNTPTPTHTPVKDQQAYASAYDHSAAKPTQIVFNINNLASFDRTTVASSAEERDLMAAMEERIAGAVYQIFAEASNQAQRVMDLT